MPKLKISEAFAQYGATLRNVQWSVSAWTPSNELVVSLWAHHWRRGPDGTIEFADRLDRWRGPGNSEFRQNLRRALDERRIVRLVIVRTVEAERVQTGEDATRIPKDFDLRPEFRGEVIHLEADSYVIRFSSAQG